MTKENIYGSHSINVNKNDVQVDDNIGREYGAKGILKIICKEVEKVEGKVQGEVRDKIIADKKGVKSKTGDKGQAGGEVKFENIDIKVKVLSDLKVGVGVDKKGLHADVKGGIHTRVNAKNTKTGKSAHISGDAEGKTGTTFKNGKVTTHKNNNLRGTGLSNISKGNNKKKYNQWFN